jgi:hypothetical protein
VSEIPFVNRLGDAIDEAIAPQAATRASRRRGRRRFLAVALAALVLAGGAAAIAQILGDPDELATGSVACYEGGYPGGNVAVDWAGTSSPIAVCAEVLGTDRRSLVACDSDGSVAVLRRRGPSTCARAGLGPLPAGYGAARAKVAELERDVLAIQNSADCIPPGRLARRVQALLDRSGWTGWRTTLRLDVYEGPCGAVLKRGGTPRLTLSGSLDTEARRVMVFGGPPRSLGELLYGTEAEPGINAWLVDASGRRCFTPAGLRGYARRQLRSTGRRISFRKELPLGPGMGLAGARGRRYRAGCAILTSADPAPDFRGVVLRVLHEP